MLLVLKSLVLLGYLLGHGVVSQYSLSVSVNHNQKIKNKAPIISWQHIPTRTRSLAFVVKDLGVPMAARYAWVVYNISPKLKEIVATQLAKNWEQGLNSHSQQQYSYQPSKQHNYIVQLYALDTVFPKNKHFDAARLNNAMRNHVLAKAVKSYQ
jgi:Raf kinase inhibitor-like YbhB/YbcL family protein